MCLANFGKVWHLTVFDFAYAFTIEPLLNYDICLELVLSWCFIINAAVRFCKFSEIIQVIEVYFYK